RELQHRVEQRPRVAAARRFVLAALAGEKGPESSHAGHIPAAPVFLLPVAVVVVPIPPRTLRRVHLDRPVHDRERRHDARIRWRPDSEPHELEKSGVDDQPLVPRAAAVVDLERLAAIGFAVLLDAWTASSPIPPPSAPAASPGHARRRTPPPDARGRD